MYLVADSQLRTHSMCVRMLIYSSYTDLGRNQQSLHGKPQYSYTGYTVLSLYTYSDLYNGVTTLHILLKGGRHGNFCYISSC